MTQSKPVFIKEEEEEALRQPETKKEANEKNNYKTATFACAALALVGLIFGAFGMIRAIGLKDHIPDDLEVRIKNDNGTTTALSSDQFTVTEKTKTVTISELPKADEGFTIDGMGIRIKGLENLAVYYFSKGAPTPDAPVATLTVGHNWGIPTLEDGTTLGIDSVPIVNAATIYAYNPDSLFDQYVRETTCSVEIGQIGDYKYCVQRLDYPEGLTSIYMAEDVNQAWMNWYDEGTDKIMEVLSNPENYVAI